MTVPQHKPGVPKAWEKTPEVPYDQTIPRRWLVRSPTNIWRVEATSANEALALVLIAHRCGARPELSDQLDATAAVTDEQWKLVGDLTRRPPLRVTRQRQRRVRGTCTRLEHYDQQSLDVSL